MKNKYVVNLQKVIDEKETLTYKEYEKIGFMSLGIGVILTGISVATNQNNLDSSIIYPIMSIGVSSASFLAADEVRNSNIKKILIKNIKGGFNEFRKK